ncbi:MAG TPA: D-glycerate dehydrogenase [Gaiellaceae bacterium]|nr:D-glycerate dehydrogenase [Gaiellaceae bacterium]
MKSKIFLSRRVPAPVRQELDRLFELALHDSERPLERDRLLAGVAGRDGVITMLTDRVDDEFLDAAGPNLRTVANYAVGYDNVDVEAATRRGVIVSNTPDVLTEATAELTLALMLAVARRIAEGDRLIRRREEWIWAPTFMLGATLRGRTLGIVGLGRIGSEVARLARAHGLEVVYTNRSGPVDSAFEWVTFEDLLARADIVSLHCPLTPETYHLIGPSELRSMRPTAFLVNTTRGPVVDEEALAEALRTGQIAGAGLDVFEREPEVSDGLIDLENAVLVPHLGSATDETREAMGMLCVSALQAVLLEDRCPANAVNSDAWEAAAARQGG